MKLSRLPFASEVEIDYIIAAHHKKYPPALTFCTRLTAGFTLSLRWICDLRRLSFMLYSDNADFLIRGLRNELFGGFHLN